MKTLILSCNTGGGHNTAARALKEVFESRGQECIIKDALSFGSQTASDFVCERYLEMVKKTPKLFGNLYKMGETWYQNKPENAHIKSPVYYVNSLYTDSLWKYIEKENFDAIICTHIFPAQALTHLKHRKKLCPLFYISTDYSCIPMLEETEMDIIFSPHKDALKTFTTRGINKDIIVDAGIPVSQKFCMPKDKLKAREELNLPADSKVVLQMSGSMGFGDTLETAEEILKSDSKDLKLIVITGNNTKMYKKFQKTFPNEDRLILLGFTDKVSAYMEASDILLTKPGGLSSTEALVSGIALIHTSPIPGCETENADFFQEHHLSLVADTPAEAAEKTELLLRDDFLSKQILSAQKHYKHKNSAKFIVDYINQHLGKITLQGNSQSRLQ